MVRGAAGSGGAEEAEDQVAYTPHSPAPEVVELVGVRRSEEGYGGGVEESDEEAEEDVGVFGAVPTAECRSAR
jgi:hypothetical protein